MDEDEVAKLEERVAKGIAWLTEHDPSGGFYFMYKAGITKFSPMPSRSEEERTLWIRWYDNMVAFWTLFERMERAQRKLAQQNA